MLNETKSSEDVKRFATGFELYKELMKESRLKIKSSDPEEVIPVVDLKGLSKDVSKMNNLFDM